MIQKKTLLTLVTFMILAFAQPIFAAYEIQTTGAEGYDLVAYQTQHQAIKGNKKIRSYLNGTTYFFMSDADKKDFDANPNKYLPAYGGFCAMAMSLGKKHPIDPTVFNIVNGKLYLNGSKETQATWLKDVPGNIKKADANWEKIQMVSPADL